MSERATLPTSKKHQSKTPPNDERRTGRGQKPLEAISPNDPKPGQRISIAAGNSFTARCTAATGVTVSDAYIVTPAAPPGNFVTPSINVSNMGGGIFACTFQALPMTGPMSLVFLGRDGTCAVQAIIPFESVP